jgi:hypothetical protein
MIEDKDILPYNFFAYKGIYTGQCNGRRYRIWRDGEKPDFVLRACVWDGPLASDYVEEDKKTYAEFASSEEGRLQAIDWLNEQCGGVE